MQAFYYKKRVLDKVIGIVWMLISISHLTFFIFLINASNSPITVFLLILPLLHAMLDIFYLRLYRRTYISVVNDEISIDRGMIIPPFQFNINDISLARMVGDRIRIELKSGKEYRIMSSAVSLTDLERIEHILMASVS